MLPKTNTDYAFVALGIAVFAASLNSLVSPDGVLNKLRRPNSEAANSISTAADRKANGPVSEGSKSLDRPPPPAAAAPPSAGASVTNYGENTRVGDPESESLDVPIADQSAQNSMSAEESAEDLRRRAQ